MSPNIRLALRVGLLAVPAVAALAAVWVAPVIAQDSVPTLYAFDEALSGDDEQRLRWPTAVAAGRVGEIAIADAGASGVGDGDGDGPAIWIFRDRGGAEGWVHHLSIQLPAAAYSLASSGDGDTYLVSTRQPGLLLSVEGPGYELRELELASQIVPGAVALLSDGGILVHDLAAGRMLVLDSDLGTRMSIALPGTVAALAPGPGGGFYVTLPQAGEVRRYGANGKELAILMVPGLGPAPSWPVGLLVESSGEVVVVDRHGGRVMVISTSGRWVGSGSRRGWEPGLLRFPADVARLPDGRVAVADQGNGRVQLFRRLEK